MFVVKIPHKLKILTYSVTILTFNSPNFTQNILHGKALEMVNIEKVRDVVCIYQ